MIRKYIFFALTALLLLSMIPAAALASDSNADGYNDNDFNKLQDFLDQPSAVGGNTNGQQLNTAYNREDPTTWTGITWNTDTPKRVTSIQTQNKNLAGELDVSGFTGLIDLYCNSNEITAINLNDASALSELLCYNNQLTELDVTSCTAIEDLACGANQISTLAIGSKDRLELINCVDNPLGTLDVSGVPNLLSLTCYNNDLVVLDVSSNPLLLGLTCSDNQITNLDISNNTALQALMCSNNQITNLDISKNTDLQILVCNNNELSHLDVSHGSLLALHCNSNSLMVLDLSANLDLTELQSSDNPLTDISANMFGASIQVHADGEGTISLFSGSGSFYTQAVPTYAFIDWTEGGTQVSTDTGYKLTAGTSYDLTANFELELGLDANPADGIIDVGGQVTIVPNITGGTWDYPNEYLSAVINSATGVAIFTGLQQGTATVSYTAGEQQVPFDITIEPAYDDNDFDKLQAFFDQPSAEAGITNGQQMSSAYDRNDPTTWNGVIWNKGTPKRVISILTQGRSLAGPLDVSDFTELEELFCNDNEIDWVNASGNTDMYIIDCRNNQLSSLDVSMANRLRTIMCTNNQLTDLDLTTNTNLLSLICGNNQLTDLDLTTNTNLLALYCDNNQLTTLDLIANTNLDRLESHDNPLTNISANMFGASILITAQGDGDISLFSDGTVMSAAASEEASVYDVEWLDSGVPLSTGLIFNMIPGTDYDLTADFVPILELDANPADGIINVFGEIIISPNISDGNWDYPSEYLSADIDLATGVAIFTGLAQGTATVSYNAGEQQLPFEITIEQEYDENDFYKLQAFLDLPSTQDDLTNGQQLNPDYNSEDPTTWTGVTWNSDSPKRVVSIEARDKQLAGSLDVSDFAKLNLLQCDGNQITDINLSGDRELSELNCSSNLLTELDVGDCTALNSMNCALNELTTLTFDSHDLLEFINCSENELGTLDVSGAPALTFLVCDNNNLASLDVRSNEMLESLNCLKNDIVSLDVRANPLLVDLSCSNNQLTTLDLSENINLNFLDCSDNALTSLDVRENLGLTQLVCVNNGLTSLFVGPNSELFLLNCFDNALTSLDVSTLTSLTTLDCENNALTSLDVSSNSSLSFLNCSNNELATLKVSGATDLEHLICGSNALEALDVSENYALIQLDCNYNQLTSLNLSSNKELVSLESQDNPLTDIQANLHGGSIEVFAGAGGYISLFSSDNLLYAEAAPQTTVYAVYWLQDDIILSTGTLFNMEPGTSYDLTVDFVPLLELDADPSDGIILVDGQILITPNIPGGTWDYLSEYLSAVIDPVTGVAIFTGLQEGKVTVEYTAGEQTVLFDVTINPILGLFVQPPDGIIVVGGQIEIVPNITGGTWDYPEEFLSADITPEAAVFTGLQAGAARVTYNAGGQSAHVDVTIDPILTLEADPADGIIVVGGQIRLTPNITGGTWNYYPDEYLSADITPLDAVFTGLQQGIAKVTYTADGQTVEVEVTIQPKLVLQATPEDGVIYEDGRIVIVPNITGGTWDYPDEYLSADITDVDAVFTGLKPGVARITYNVGEQSAYIDVTIKKKDTPITGQDFTLVIVLLVFAIGVIVLAKIIMKKKRGL